MSKPTKFHHLDDDEDTGSEYEVGYGKPPKSGQFKKGQSGNRSGRKPRVAYEEDELPFRRYMMEKRVAKISGENREVTGYDALFFKLFQKAMEGDFKSAKLLIQESGGFKEFRAEWKRQKSEADQRMIEMVLEAGERLINPSDAKRVDEVFSEVFSNKKPGRGTRDH